MVLRKPNLLDAFQASAPEGKKAPVGQTPANAAGPFAGADPQSVPSPRFGAPAPRGFLARVLSDRAVLFTLLVCVIAVGVAYYLGRQTSPRDAQAAGPAAGEAGSAGMLLREGASAPAATPDPIEANRKAAQLSGSVHDAAFFDPKYKFTVRVRQFANDEAGTKAALELRDYLRGEGLPVVQPLVCGRWIVVCVGYKAEMHEIEEMRDFVRKLSGPKGSKKAPFADAWIDNISNVAARK